MSHPAATPSATSLDITILPRDRRFGLEERLQGDWHGGSRAKTAVFNALSLMFPVGERFFIDAVRSFLEEVQEPALRRQIVAFCRQEAAHGREHGEYNAVICARAGCDVAVAERPIRRRIEDVRRRFPKLNWLASTVAYEHLTAVLAGEILTDPRWLAGADPQVADLWRWHAVEETEHKSVAFDVYVHVGGSYQLRALVMRFVLFYFHCDLVWNLRHLLRGAPERWTLAWEILVFLYGREGLFRVLRPAVTAYFSPTFHPWQDDNRAQLEDARRALDAAA